MKHFKVVTTLNRYVGRLATVGPFISESSELNSSREVVVSHVYHTRQLPSWTALQSGPVPAFREHSTHRSASFLIHRFSDDE